MWYENDICSPFHLHIFPHSSKAMRLVLLENELNKLSTKKKNHSKQRSDDKVILLWAPKETLKSAGRFYMAITTTCVGSHLLDCIVCHLQLIIIWSSRLCCEDYHEYKDSITPTRIHCLPSRMSFLWINFISKSWIFLKLILRGPRLYMVDLLAVPREEVGNSSPSKS